MYYKGDILSLWIFLSELFHRFDENELYSPSKLASTPHLVYLHLRYLECAFLIRKMTSSGIKTSIKLEDLLKKLDKIIIIPSLDPEIKTRALCLRVIEMCSWCSDRVDDANGGPVAAPTKLKAIELSQEAIRIHNEFSTENGPAVMYVRAMVRRSLLLPRAQETWVTACADLRLLDRDDLYFSLKSITQQLFRAISSGDVSALRDCLPALDETLSLGEWGKIFYDKWWRAEELKIAKTSLWRKARGMKSSGDSNSWTTAP